MKSIKSRDQFVKQVAEVIKNSEREDGEAFVFGISGRWGEGKSYFLTSLEKQLKPYKVIRVNPWKFAKNDNSFMRAFLSSLSKLVERPLKNRIEARLNCEDTFSPKELDSLYYDKTSQRVNLKILGSTLIFLLLLILGYKLVLSPTQREYIRHLQTAIIIIFIPLLLALMQRITTTMRSSKAITTSDSFDKLLVRILSFVEEKYVVIFVDDLDRLTAKRAISVLDDLRTFFDNEKLVFVVAGDHSVLERHLGKELYSGGDKNEKLEEGRRFLKKIFNVYWHLPLPTKTEIGDYIDGLTDEKSNKYIFDWLRDKTHRQIFKTYLQQYFSNNFRNIRRFIDRVDFTFRVIDAQSQNTELDDESKSYFEEMKQNPILVVRILMFEELANPLFDRLLSQPKLLIRLEKAATDRESIEDLLKENGEFYLSFEQRLFVESFLYQHPRFRDESGDRVKSIESYISLSSDSSFGDSRGYSPEEFMQRLEGENYPDLVQVLDQSGDEKLKADAEAFVKAITGLADAGPKSSLLTKYVNMLRDLDIHLDAFQIMSSNLDNIDYSFMKSLSPEDRLNRIEEISNVLQEKGNPFDTIESLSLKLDLLIEDMGQLVKLTNNTTELTSIVILKHLDETSTGYAASNLDAIGPYLVKLNSDTKKEVAFKLKDQLINSFKIEDNNARRNIRLELLRASDEALEELRNMLKEEIKQKNTGIWAWIVTNASSGNSVLTEGEVTDILASMISVDPAVANVKSVLNLAIDWQTSADAIWEAILTALSEDELLQLIIDLYNVNPYAKVAPSRECAVDIAKKVINRFVAKKNFDENVAIEWLNRINVSNALFSNLNISDKSLLRLIDEKLKRVFVKNSENVRARLEAMKP